MKNVLVQYKGGGYEGCFWEWNFFAYDINGDFHCIMSSGRDGINNAEDAQTYLSDSQYRKDKDYYIYKLGTKKGLKDIATEINSGLVMGLVKWFENFCDIELFPNWPYALCSKCGSEIGDPDEIHLEGFAGAGGMEIQANLIICPDCYTCCDECGEYYNGEFKEVDDQYLCEYCVEERK